MKEAFLFIVSILFYYFSFSQNDRIIYNNNDSLFSISAKVIERDSSYWFNADIKLLKQANVQIPEEIIFDNGLEMRNPLSNAGMLFAKNIRFHFVYFIVDDLLTIQYDRTGEIRKFVCLKPDSTIKVTVDLQSLFPIEKGMYKVYFFINTIIEGEKTRIFSEPIFFEAKYDPPRFSRF